MTDSTNNNHKRRRRIYGVFDTQITADQYAALFVPFEDSLIAFASHGWTRNPNPDWICHNRLQQFLEIADVLLMAAIPTPQGA